MAQCERDDVTHSLCSIKEVKIWILCNRKNFQEHTFKDIGLVCNGSIRVDYRCVGVICHFGLVLETIYKPIIRDPFDVEKSTSISYFEFKSKQI